MKLCLEIICLIRKNRAEIGLNPIARCVILIIEKGKPETHVLPSINYDNCFTQPFTIASSGRLFSILEDLITKTNKSDNEDTCLYQIRICNHWHRPPFFRLEG